MRNQCEGGGGTRCDICQVLHSEHGEGDCNKVVSRTSEAQLKDARTMYTNSEFWEKVLIIGTAAVVLILLMIYFFGH